MNTTAYKWGNPAALLPYTTKAGETTKVPECAVRLLRAFEQLTDEQKEALTVCAVRMAREAVGGADQAWNEPSSEFITTCADIDLLPLLEIFGGLMTELSIAFPIKHKAVMDQLQAAKRGSAHAFTGEKLIPKSYL